MQCFTGTSQYEVGKAGNILMLTDEESELRKNDSNLHSKSVAKLGLDS